jgi:hypothetical protein
METKIPGKVLVLVRGASGSGKTTFAHLVGTIARCTGDGDYPWPHDVVATDDFFYDDGGNYNFDSSKLGENHKKCQDKVSSLMDTFGPSGKHIILVHNTFTQEWEMDPYFELAQEHGYTVMPIVVENRHGSDDVHDVPEYVKKQQKERFEISL